MAAVVRKPNFSTLLVVSSTIECLGAQSDEGQQRRDLTNRIAVEISLRLGELVVRNNQLVDLGGCVQLRSMLQPS